MDNGIDTNVAWSMKVIGTASDNIREGMTDDGQITLADQQCTWITDARKDAEQERGCCFTFAELLSCLRSYVIPTSQ